MTGIRVEMVLPTLEAAGMETVVVEMARRLVDRGSDVGITCIFEGGPLEARLADAGIRVSIVPAAGARTNLATGDLEAHFRTVRPDIVHSHSGTWMKASLAAVRAGVPGTVHTVHGLHDRERWQELLVMWGGSLFSDRIVAVSEPLEAYLRDRVRVASRKLSTILNGVDAERYAPDGSAAGLRARLGLSDSAVLVGNVARLAPVKDHDTLVRAFALALERGAHAHLVLVGEGPLMPDVRSTIEELRVSDRVHLVGAVADTAPIYRDLDVFVLSSIAEGTSMSVLEALASGVACVATDVGGNGHLLGRGEHGRLVPSRDAPALSRALEDLVRDGEERQRLGRLGRAFVEAGFTLDASLDRYLAMYAEAMRAPRRLYARRRPG